MLLCDAPRLMFCGIGKAWGGIGREQRVISGQREAHCMVQGGLVDPAFNASKTQLVLSELVVCPRRTDYDILVLIRLLTGEC